MALQLLLFSWKRALWAWVEHPGHKLDLHPSDLPHCLHGGGWNVWYLIQMVPHFTSEKWPLSDEKISFFSWMRVFFVLYLPTLNTFLYSLPHCQFTKWKFLMYSCEHKSTCKYLKIVHSCVDQSFSEQQHLRLYSFLYWCLQYFLQKLNVQI